eukprot:1912045-Prymnesium_polylepis.1
MLGEARQVAGAQRAHRADWPSLRAGEGRQTLSALEDGLDEEGAVCYIRETCAILGEHAPFWEWRFTLSASRMASTKRESGSLVRAAGITRR